MSIGLLEMAEAKDHPGVLATYRDRPLPEVVAAAEHLREDDAYQVAIELYRWLLDHEETATSQFGIGQCLGKIYDYDTAAAHLGRAFDLDPGRTEGASYYAYILERLGRLDAAAPWYERALAGADSEDLWARSHHAWFLEKWGRAEEACAAFEEVLRRDPGYTWAVKRYSLLLRALGRRDEAEALLTGAVDRNPGSPFARLNLLEYRLIDEDGPGYEQVRAAIDPASGPPWHGVVVELFDIYRDDLLPARVDASRVSAWEASASALLDSVHRDFDDLTALLVARNGDVDTWTRMIRLLLK